MDTTTIVALIVALGTGIALGIQATTNSRVGLSIGPLDTGLLVIIAGGVLSAIAFALFRSRAIGLKWVAIRQTLFGIVLAGTLAVVAIIGTAYALPRTSVAAGVAAIVFGQMAVAVMVDATGWGGTGQVPLSAGRLAGLALLAISVWLLVPRTE